MEPTSNSSTPGRGPELTDKEIRFRVTLDKEHLPEAIEWDATDSGQARSCNALLLSIWDGTEKSTLAIDLWTKDLPVDEMNIHFFQTLLKLADTHERATGRTDAASLLNRAAKEFARLVELPLPEK